MSIFCDVLGFVLCDLTPSRTTSLSVRMIFCWRKVNFPEKGKVCAHYYIAVSVGAFLVDLSVHRMAGQYGWGRKAPLEPIQSAHKGLKRADCPVSCPVKFWISSDFMKERNTFFLSIYILLECYLSWQPPNFYCWFFQMVKLSVFIISIFVLPWTFI